MTKATPLSFSILRPEFAETKDIFLMIWVELALKIHRFIISNILAIEYIRHSINEGLDPTQNQAEVPSSIVRLKQFFPMEQFCAWEQSLVCILTVIWSRQPYS